jgi:hypothetical protein
MVLENDWLGTSAAEEMAFSFQGWNVTMCLAFRPSSVAHLSWDWQKHGSQHARGAFVCIFLCTFSYLIPTGVTVRTKRKEKDKDEIYTK